MNRSKHLAWTKERAIAYAQQGDIQGTMASFLSDMSKHDELAKHPAIPLMQQLFAMGHLSTPDKMNNFIEGFR